jgi:chemotaxis response regulator CheB
MVDCQPPEVDYTGRMRMSTGARPQHQPPSHPRVLMLCCDGLVCAAVHLALQKQGIELLGMECDPEKGLSAIRTLLPDVVLMEGPGWDADFTAGVWTALHERTGAQVIHISPEDNQILICHQEQRLVGSAHELAQIIFDSAEVKP